MDVDAPKAEPEAVVKADAPAEISEIETGMSRDALAAALAQVTTEANQKVQQITEQQKGLLEEMERQKSELEEFRQQKREAEEAKVKAQADNLKKQLEELQNKGFATDGIKRGILEMSKVDADQAAAMVAVRGTSRAGYLGEHVLTVLVGHCALLGSAGAADAGAG